MSKTIYEYATKSWPVANGCCEGMRCAKKCWAKRTVNRLAHSPNPKVRAEHEGLVATASALDIDGDPCELLWAGVTRLNEAHLLDPLRWRAPQRVAVAYHGDLFRLPAEQIDRVFAVMALCPQHTFLTLTKCPERMREYLTYHFRVVSPGPRECVFGIVQNMPGYDHEHPKWTRLAAHAFDVVPLRNVLLGVSCLDQSDADAAREPMCQLAAAGWRTWVSHEPAWGGIDWRGWEFLSYMVSGGESGSKARPSHPDWFHADRDFCVANGIPWMLKQWGEWAPKAHFANFAEWDRAAAHALVNRNGTWSAVPGRDEPDPEFGLTCADLDGNDYAAAMARVGKRAAGRLLDGREHLALPEVQLERR